MSFNTISKNICSTHLFKSETSRNSPTLIASSLPKIAQSAAPLQSSSQPQEPTAAPALSPLSKPNLDLIGKCHDTRNQFTGLIGHLELLNLETASLAVATHSVQDARLCAGLARSIFLKGSGEGNEDFSIEQLIDNIRVSASAQANKKRLCLTFTLDENLKGLKFNGDLITIHQTVTNLINNAIKFTNKGGVNLTIGSSPNGNISFTVIDTGPGIPPDKIGELFKPFSQVGSASENARGTGIGLMNCQKFVESLNPGEIIKAANRSDGQKGAVFQFEIPLQKASLNEQKTPETVAPGESPAAAFNKPFEDNPFTHICREAEKDIHETLEQLNALANKLSGYENEIPNDDLPELKKRVERTLLHSKSAFDSCEEALHLGKLEAGQVQLGSEQFSVDILKESIHGRAQLRALNKQIKINFTYNPQSLNTTNFSGDPNHITRILKNLLTKTVEIAPPGATVQVNVQEDPHNQRLFHFKIIATPPSEIHLDLRQLEKELCYPQKLVQMTNPQSCIEIGTSEALFRFTLSLKRVSEKSASSSDTSSNLTKLRVSFADDSEINRKVMEASLRKLKIPNPSSFDDGAPLVSAFEICSPQRRPDAIFLDLEMPMGGVATATRIRQIQEQELGHAHRRSLLFAVTGNDPEHGEHCLFDGHITKPVTQAKLEKALRLATPPSQSRNLGKAPYSAPPLPSIPSDPSQET